MGKGNRHIPYRNSMMTTVLRDSLGGNCKTTMIATVTTKGDQLDESISTCRFAQRVAMISNKVRLLVPRRRGHPIPGSRCRRFHIPPPSTMMSFAACRSATRKL